MLCISTAVVELSCGLGCSVVCSSAAHSLSLHFHCIWQLVGCFTTRLDAEAETCAYRRGVIGYVGFGMCWHVARVRVRKHRTNQGEETQDELCPPVVSHLNLYTRLAGIILIIPTLSTSI
jgi:hypothetical protein